jgi:RNA polymerase sigma-70 factor, ECF subfamily
MIPAEARGAWHEIETRLRPYVGKRVASASDVDDILQEIFLRMQRGIAGLRDSERFGGWIYRIAEHVIIDRARARARQPLLGIAEPPEPASPEGSDDGDDLQAALGECVALFVARLPATYREAITLTELQGLTQKDAAELLGVSLSGMKSRVQRGREKVREMFHEVCQVSLDCRGRVVGCEPRALEQLPEDCRCSAVEWPARRNGCR